MADVIANGVRFNVQRLGTGPRKIVFIHGILIDNLSGFYLTVGPALSKDHSLIMYDLRGHGRSEQPPNGYSLSQMALDLNAILDALGLGNEKVTLVGNSSGVPIAIAYAVMFPEHVEGLALVDGMLNARGFASKVLDTLMVEDGEPHPDATEIWENWRRQHFFDGQLDRDGEDTQRLLGRLDSQRRSPLLTTARGLVYKTDLAKDIQAEPPFDDDDLKHIECPVLALYGDESDLVPEARRLAENLPRCEFVLIPDAGHGILRQAAPRLREELTRWLAETSSGVNEGGGQ
jgi:pimeloyl-ACP methyl ester carboxylesterase